MRKQLLRNTSPLVGNRGIKLLFLELFDLLCSVLHASFSSFFLKILFEIIRLKPYNSFSQFKALSGTIYIDSVDAMKMYKKWPWPW
jgi:hypothetical protein